jgi:hypothetical protein
MAFRSGGFKGKGLVYSRKPKYGKTGNGSLQNGSSIIFEENEVETDDPGMHFQHELRRTSNSHTGINRLTYAVNRKGIFSRTNPTLHGRRRTTDTA